MEEKAAGKDNVKRIEELYRDRERHWDNTWDSNRKLRSTFRHERKIRKREQDATDAQKDRIGTNIDILPEHTNDVERAKLVTFGDVERNRSPAAGPISLANTDKRQRCKTHSLGSLTGKESRKQALQNRILQNTRASLNPF